MLPGVPVNAKAVPLDSTSSPSARLLHVRVQVLVPVALMQPDQSSMSGHAYMLVNREDFPSMMGQPAMMPAAAPGHPVVGDHKPPGHDIHGDMLDVLVGAAHRVETADNEGRGLDGAEDDDDDVGAACLC